MSTNVTSAKNTSDAYLTELHDGVLVLSLNRPEQGNAVPPEAVPGLINMLRSAQQDRCIRCLLIRGEGKHLSTGGNIERFAQGLSAGIDTFQADMKERMANLGQLVEVLVGFDRPIVTAAQGGVAGAGLLFTLAADFVIGDDTTFFLFAHQRIALTPDAGVSWLLPRVVGLRTAKTLLLGAARIGVEEASKIGLLTSVAPPGELDALARKLAHRLSQAPQTAVRTAKALLDGAMTTSLPAQLQAEAASVVAAIADPDFAEGVRAFVEKRAAVFPSATVQ